MSKLEKQYSKEIAKSLGKIAVYFPGENIEVGDIITFPNGNTILGKPRPIGSFQKYSSLRSLGINYEEPKYSKTPDTFQYLSTDSTKLSVDLNGGGKSVDDIGLKLDAEINIEFNSSGAIYFLAVDCDKKQLNDLHALENEINIKKSSNIWKDKFLVTSVTISKKALVAQSISKNAVLKVTGDVERSKSDLLEAKANSILNVSKQQGDIFVKPWSNNVTVFMDLVKFEEKDFGSRFKGKKDFNSDIGNSPLRLVKQEVTVNDILTGK